MSAHQTRVIDITRNAHDLVRTTHKAICDGCKWRGTETTDRLSAQRAARLHEVAG